MIFIHDGMADGLSSYLVRISYYNFVFLLISTVADLIPVKQNLDEIKEECFFNDNIEFNRFKVIGQKENQRDDL